VVRALPVRHLEDEGFDAEVVSVIEGDWQVDVPERVGHHARDDAIEGKESGAQIGAWDSHGLEHVNVQDVEAAAPILQHVNVQDVEALVTDDGFNDEWVASWSGDNNRVVGLIEGDRRRRPPEQFGDGASG